MPANSPDIVVVEPVPSRAPGSIFHVPDGNPVSITLPVETSQVGWVIVPILGADGNGGSADSTILVVAADGHPSSVVTMQV